jgi:hypothetical protein
MTVGALAWHLEIAASSVMGAALARLDVLVGLTPTMTLLMLDAESSAWIIELR